MATILVAEDEPDISELITISLEFGGYDVVTARNGAEAVERAHQTQPDLILLDVRMPIMTGYEACEALKQSPETADIPVIFLSAKGQDEEVEAGLRAGGLDYILKPFAVDRLLERVQEVFDAAARGEQLTGCGDGAETPPHSSGPSAPRASAPRSGRADDATSGQDTRPLRGKSERAGSSPGGRRSDGGAAPARNGKDPHRKGAPHGLLRPSE